MEIRPKHIKIYNILTNNLHSSLSTISKKYNIPFGRLAYIKQAYKIKSSYKLTETQLEISNYIKTHSSVTYTEIGKLYNISETMVRYIAKKCNITRNTRYSNDDLLKTIVNINNDIKKGVSQSIINERYNLNNKLLYIKLLNLGLPNINRRYRKTRNQALTNHYKTTTAEEVLTIKDIVLDDPTRIKSVGSIYTISSLNGYKKYEKIGNRRAGGIFCDTKILNYIVRKREKYNWPFKKISEHLQAKNCKTGQNADFHEYTVSYYYRRYKKSK